MKEGKASRTADIAIAYRTAEARKRPEDRVCYDPFAESFLGGIYRVLVSNRLLMKIAMMYAERLSPGSRGWTIARHRFIDERVKQSVEGGIRQLVILGAGYDSRAYRMEELWRNIRVFEVDHPDTQRAKQEKLRKLVGTLPGHVAYVPVDFDKEKLDVKLLDSGYDKNAKTLFIWEAVTMYLTAEAVDETLAFVANSSGAGSSIVMDYIYQSVVNGTSDLRGAKGFRKQVEKRGDPLAFGIDPGTVQEFFTDRGFDQVDHVDSEFVTSAYFRGASRKIYVAPFLGYVHATVKPKQDSQAT